MISSGLGSTTSSISGRGVDCSIGEDVDAAADLDDLGDPPDFRGSALKAAKLPDLLVARLLAEAWTMRSAKMSTPPAVSMSPKVSGAIGSRLLRPRRGDDVERDPAHGWNVLRSLGDAAGRLRRNDPLRSSG